MRLHAASQVWSIGGFLPSSPQLDGFFGGIAKLGHLFGILHPEKGVSEISWLPSRRRVFFVTQEQQDSGVGRNGHDDVRAVLLLGEQSESWEPLLALPRNASSVLKLPGDSCDTMTTSSASKIPLR
jgi:hypothetical protein